jgi:enoyl-CoA hydratase/carnithine racemase
MMMTDNIETARDYANLGLAQAKSHTSVANEAIALAINWAEAAPNVTAEQTKAIRTAQKAVRKAHRLIHTNQDGLERFDKDRPVVTRKQPIDGSLCSDDQWPDDFV